MYIISVLYVFLCDKMFQVHTLHAYVGSMKHQMPHPSNTYICNKVSVTLFSHKPNLYVCMYVHIVNHTLLDQEINIMMTRVALLLY